MLSLAKLSAGATEYYELMVAQGVEEYYANTREAPGQWLGTSAAHLGLDGVVDGDEFRRVLSHAHPTTGGRLTDGKSVPKVVGFDATFCAPKSVSLLFALGHAGGVERGPQRARRRRAGCVRHVAVVGEGSTGPQRQPRSWPVTVSSVPRIGIARHGRRNRICTPMS